MYIFLIFDFIIVTINLIQLLAAILIRINYLSISIYLKYCLLLPSGFNVETVEHRSLKFTLWDVGGLQKLRPLWRHYYLNTQGSY